MPDFKPWQWATLISLLIVLNIVVVGGLILLVATYDLWTSPSHLAVEPTVPPWATATATQRPTFTPTSTPETWPTSTPTRTPTRMPSPTATWTPLPTRTPLPTDTPTPYRPPTDTPAPTATRTRVPTRTPLPTFTVTPQVTATWTPTAYQPPTDTPTATATPTLTPTSQPTATLVPTVTDTPSPSATLPTDSDVPIIAGAPATITPGATLRPSPSPTHPPTATPTPTATPSPTATHTPTPSPSPSATASPSPSPTATLTPSPSPTATATPPPSPTATTVPSPRPSAGDIQPSAAQVRRVDATPVGEDRINLAWEPDAKAIAYRVYSDMGTGLGVYVFKAETEQPTLTDTGLRAGSNYRYRVQSITSAGEITLDLAAALTPLRSDFWGGGRHATLTSAGDVPEPTPQRLRVTPAPTPLPPDTVILGLLSASDHADDVDNTLTIVGEVRNDSHLDVGQAVITVTFYGSDGQVIAEVSGSTLLQALAPGIRSPFIITLPHPTGLANYSLRATGRPVALATDGSQLDVVNTRRFEDAAGFYHVAGVIENQSQRRVEPARVIVTLYDRGGRVVNVGFAYPQPSSLSPRDRADFDVTFAYYPKVFSHQAIAVAD